MHHLAIAALLLVAGCGSKADKAGAATSPAPAVTAEAPPTTPGPTVVDGLELGENQRFGRLLSVELDADFDVCFVTVLIPGRDGGSIFDADPAVCEEDHSAYLDEDVVISLDGDRDVTSVVPWSEYR